MRRLGFHLLILSFLITLSFPLAAQFGGGGRGGDGGFFAVANPAKAGRVVTVGGRLVPVRKIDHAISVSGFVDALLVRVGERVEEGQPLIRITRDVVGETFRPVTLPSRLKGIVSEIHVYETEEVSPGTPAVTILDDRSYLLKTTLSDRDAPAIRALGAVPVRGTTPEGVPFSGRILAIAQEPDYSTGLFTLTMEFPKRVGLFLGMVLFVDLPAQASEGMTVEETALFREEGKTYLWVLTEDDGLSLRGITAGETIEAKVVVVEGLSPGERYVRRLTGNEKEGMGPRDLIQANLNGGPSPGKN